MSSDKYHIPSDDELKSLSMEDCMPGDILLRPDGSVVSVLGEPEDRSFWRDASDVVDELNKLQARVDAANERLRKLGLAEV